MRRGFQYHGQNILILKIPAQFLHSSLLSALRILGIGLGLCFRSFALAGFFLYGPQALLGVTASKQATKKAASSALGIIGIMSYVSVIFTGAGLGWYSDRFGWDSLYLLMAGVSAVGFIFVAVLWNIKDDGYLKEETK